MSPVPENINENFDQRLRRLAAALPAGAPPEALRAHVLDGLPTARPTRPMPTRLRFAAAGLAAFAHTALLVAGLHSGLRPASAAEVSAAILRANTWHFVGWHLEDGHKVRWEVWGRRSPSFYREEIGDEVYLDDGTRSTHILPPDPKNGRRHGVVLILPSRPQTPPALADSGTNFLVGIGGDAAGLNLRGSAGNTETFEARTEYAGYPTDTKETTTLTVDRSTHLPVRYVVRHIESLPIGSPGVGAGLDYRTLRKLREYTEAELTPTYDVPLPGDLAAVHSPGGFVVADGTEAATVEGPEGSVATGGGLTVRAEVVGQDAEGDLRLHFHGWLGRQPVSARDMGVSLDGLLTSGRYGSDDRGNAYVSVGVPGGIIGAPDGGMDVWLVAAEPLAPAAPPPTTLNLRAVPGLARYERMGRSGRYVSVVSQVMTFHLRLPAQKGDLGYDEATRRLGAGATPALPSLAVEAAQSRAMFYSNGEATGNWPAFAPDYERAAHWYEVAAQAAAQDGDARWAGMYRVNAATMRRLAQGAR